MKTVSVTDANRHFTQILQSAETDPVCVTRRGQSAFVIVSYEQYRTLTKGRSSIADLFAFPGAEDIEFDPAPINIEPREVDLS